MFGTSFSAAADEFQNNYKDLSMRLKERKIDLVIVVNMFQPGFDAATLNTLWAEKNLRAHGLIQAFSRTNRILNSVKTYGNIVSFRNLEKETNDALALFGNKHARSIVLLKPYVEYIAEYQELIEKLQSRFAPGETITGEDEQKEFVKLFGDVLRLRNILTSFDDFAADDTLSARDVQDYQSTYLDIHTDLRTRSKADRESILDDVVFEIELIKQVEINVDYILLLVEQYIATHGTGDNQEIKATIDRAVSSSPALRNKKDLIEAFVNSVTTSDKIDDAWQAFIAVSKLKELDRIIADGQLQPEPTRTFMANAFRDGSVPTSGTAITTILPPVSRFSRDNSRSTKKQTVLDKLVAYFERFDRLG